MLIGAMNHPGRPIKDELKWISEAGLDFVDLTIEPPAALPDRAALYEIRSLLQDYGLKVVGHTAYYLPIGHPYRSLAEVSVDELKATIDIFAELGAASVNVHPDGHAPHHPRSFVVNRNIEMIARLIEHAAALGIGIMVENVPGTFNTKEQLAELLGPLPALGFHLDIGHANINAYKDNGAELIKNFSSRLKHVHLHDNRNNLDLHLPLGAGTIPWREIVGLLKESGYDSTITLEVFSDDRHFLLRSRDLLRAAWDGS